MKSDTRTLYKKTLDFGKVDADMTGEKVNEVTVTIELRGTPIMGRVDLTGFGKLPDDLTLSITGDVWNTRHTDIIMGGQCYDELLELVPSPLMHEVVGVWKRWHLNGMNAGDAVQEQWLRENGHGKDYTETCEKLEQAGLLVHDGYKYGSEWKYEALPREIVNKVMSWHNSTELVEEAK